MQTLAIPKRPRSDPSRLVVTTEMCAGALLVRLDGDASIATADKLQVVLDQVAALRPGCVVFDLAGLRMITSLALGGLLSLRRSLQRTSGRLVVAQPSEVVAEVLEAVGLTSLFQVQPTVTAALRPTS